eukprot:TRINITY_DN38756_c0_g1_i1.p1 TRINITY_DN38756_c0_g1~~TRINITY_DN38756_c0_g1_i1.p1  ORF type:complete len:272 (+),score=78.74 TRINITY_DN38756_c0_g1_i1:42-857(+)
MASKLYGLMALAGGAGGMSAWQFHRIFWKRDLLEAREERMAEEAEARCLPKVPPPDIEKVLLRGTFYNESAVLVGPKKSRRTEHGKVETGQSYLVFVPFITEKNEHVMVCKGQVPSDVVNDGKLKEEILSSWPTHAEFEGVFRKPEKVPPNDIAKRTEELYKHPHPPMMWQDFYEKYAIKSSARQPLPYWVDVVNQPFDTPGNLPLTRSSASYATHTITPTVHTVYFATWSALFFIACYNLQRHGGRLYGRGCDNRGVMLEGIGVEQNIKW